MNLYGFNPEISYPFLGDEENAEPLFSSYNHQFGNNITDNSSNNISGQFHEHTSFDECQINVPNNLGNLLPNDPTEIPAIPDTCFNYINDLLREEYCSPDDQFQTPNSTLEDYMAAQLSYNKSLDAALHLDQVIGHSVSRVGNLEAPICEKGDQSYSDNTRRRKHDNEENGDQRKNKNITPCNDEVIEQIEQYGDGSKKRGNNKVQVPDLRGLFTRCAQCVAQVNLTGAYDMLKQIREHSPPYGDFLQRVAHYLANGLEARLEGKELKLTHANEEVSPSEVLKANRIYVASVPFQIMSYYTMNKTIARLVEEAPSIHIVDFGIYYGLQWPCIIQNLSKRPNGPPRIRITGIDFPQRGFRPAERVEETGRCLAKYCEKYNVPFEYYPIAKKWEDVQLEELKIERNEPLVVNCLYRAHLLFDESVEENSPRDTFLKLVRKINPDIFMHAVVNSTSSVPFFLNRFKEVMFHYSALFDIFESTMSKEDNERLLLESKLYGPQALNVIACEGMERVERPESYKQWQVRTQRAGFEQVGLDRELLRRARAMVKRSFREEFSYDVDGNWVVQGWKGRILYAISCWKPT
ncbi:scarecrow-like protein 30 [Chenopodium quinoa]|uniref:scarecrow-like protein 30 n=1 Tax=Chenopodium quinoa TaxID=63459 RepID=UPI000B7952A8|nr:scarecrow-like protein 30 [Chenopodium quinoa]